MNGLRPVLLRLTKEEAKFLEVDLTHHAQRSDVDTWDTIADRLAQAIEMSVIQLSLTQKEVLRRAYRLDPVAVPLVRPRTKSALAGKGLLTEDGHITPLGRLYYQEKKP